jgi:hypothetical protein
MDVLAIDTVWSRSCVPTSERIIFSITGSRVPCGPQARVFSSTHNPQQFWKANVFCKGYLTYVVGRNLEASGTRFSPLNGLAVKGVTQASRRGHVCVGLDRHKWYYPRSDSLHPPAPSVAIYYPFNLITLYLLVP